MQRNIALFPFDAHKLRFKAQIYRSPLTKKPPASAEHLQGSLVEESQEIDVTIHILATACRQRWMYGI